MFIRLRAIFPTFIWLRDCSRAVKTDSAKLFFLVDRNRVELKVAAGAPKARQVLLEMARRSV